MEILDAQLHCWLLDRPSRPWQPEYRGATRDRALNILLQTGVPMPPETLLCEMAAAGVDGAALTPQGVYGNDNSFELETAANYPRKFAVIGWIDHLNPDVEQTLERDTDRGMLGVRLLRLDADKIQRGEYDRVLTWCEEHGLAVALTVPHPVPAALEALFQRHVGMEFLIDHLGVGLAPPAYGLAPDDPWTLLPGVLALARFPNVNVKLTGAAALSHDPFPFRDLWDGIGALVDAFGPERLPWGSDITRTGALHTYAESVHYLREIDGLSGPDLELMYGQALRRILRWESDAYLDHLNLAVRRST
jgi:L-fuconolactonase